MVTALDPAPAGIPAADRAPTGPLQPRIYFATTSHRRNSNAPGAVTRTFSYTTCYWLVDVDDLPMLPRPLRPFTRFEARDHLGDPDRSHRRTTPGRCWPRTTCGPTGSCC